MTYKSTDFVAGDILRYTTMYNKRMSGKLCIVTGFTNSNVLVRRTYAIDPSQHIDSAFNTPIPKLYIDFIVRQKDGV